MSAEQQELRVTMVSRNNTNTGQAFHVGDCYVWSEIWYLDSPTDYREYLPQNGGHARTIVGEDLVMLDTSWHLPDKRTVLHLVFIVMFALVFPSLLWYVWQYLQTHLNR